MSDNTLFTSGDSLSTSGDTEKLPNEIAKIVFSSEPSPPKTFDLCCQEIHTQTEMIDIFEIFLTILLEGILMKYPITADSIKHLTPETITNLQPWLNSMGFNVDVAVVSQSDTELYEEYYCKVILREDPAWSTYFELHENITEDYHFIFGGESPYFSNEECTLENLFSIFVFQNRIFKMSFSLI
jgi:hypothetical protein